jgi:hypothetical protein
VSTGRDANSPATMLTTKSCAHIEPWYAGRQPRQRRTTLPPLVTCVDRRHPYSGACFAWHCIWSVDPVHPFDKVDCQDWISRGQPRIGQCNIGAAASDTGAAAGKTKLVREHTSFESCASVLLLYRCGGQKCMTYCTGQMHNTTCMPPPPRHVHVHILLFARQNYL